jgi:hypothetical protein
MRTRASEWAFRQDVEPHRGVVPILSHQILGFDQVLDLPPKTDPGVVVQIDAHLPDQPGGAPPAFGTEHPLPFQRDERVTRRLRHLREPDRLPAVGQPPVGAYELRHDRGPGSRRRCSGYDPRNQEKCERQGRVS